MPIPAGFYYVGGTKDSGLVISDDSNDENKYQGLTTVGTDLEGNQFVWIPVENYSDFHLIEGYNSTSLQTYLSGSTNPSREAGSTTEEGTPLEINSTAGTAESIAMYKSVKDNGGFYIARYEAGISGTTENFSLGTSTVTDGSVPPLSKAGVGVWNAINWGDSYSTTGTDGLQGSDLADGAVKVARSMYPNTSKLVDYDLPTDLTNDTEVTSTLCYGVQWDAIMQFIDSNYVSNSCTDDSFVKNSTNNGNYSGDVSTTGAYSVKNIYDLAGNVGEWTMEASNSVFRVLRGYLLFQTGDKLPASNRYCSSPTGFPNYSSQTIGFRVALYL